MSNKKYRFDVFHVVVEMRENQPQRSFLNLLDNPSVPEIPIGRDGGSFVLNGPIATNGIYRTGSFKFIQMTDIPPTGSISGNTFQIPLNQNEGLAHYTSFFYDTQRGTLMVESTHAGTSSGGIAVYFQRNHQDVKDIKFNMVLDPTNEDKLSRMNIIKKIDIRVARYENGQVFDSRNRSIKQITDVADSTDTNILEVKMSAGRKRDDSLSLPRTKQLIRSLRGWTSTQEVQKILVTGNDENGDRVAIDFITDRVKIEVTLPRSRFVSDVTINRKIEAAIEEYNLIRNDLRGFNA